MEYNYLTELYHYGVKGQKWGIRRYQNPDGSLKKGHKKRYGEWPPKGKTIFESDKTDSFRLRRKDGTVDYAVSTYSNIGKRKNVAVNLITNSEDMTTKASKTKMQKAQKFVDEFVEDSSVTKSKLHSLDIEIDKGKAYATYFLQNNPLPLKVEYDTSTGEIVNKR